MLSLNRVMWRFFNRLLPLLLIALFLPRIADALQARPVSSSVVLVLKLVSATHVKPTTGIVISDDGLVLVPLDFTLSEGEIIVLDGGTDIVKHGRPASLVTQSGSAGLAVLSVKGLSRPGITLSENAPNTETELHLTAFPPAEYIAKGLPPLWTPVKIVQGELDEQFSISPETPQPYVNGAILDACGYLAGVNLTTGPQSLKPGETPSTIFADELRRTLDSMQIKLPMASCDYQPQQEVAPASTPKSKKAIADASTSEERIAKSSDPNFVKPEVYRPVITRKQLNPFQGASTRPLMPESAVTPSLWSRMPLWLPPLGIIVLGALIWKASFFLRLLKNDKKPIAITGAASRVQPASDEPDTVPLQSGSATAVAKPRSAPLDEAELPDMNALPDGCDGVLVVDGLIDPETPFKRFCIVDTRQINIVIGRGDTDININHPFISRVHARLESNGEFMTLSDLGSSSGTFIKGVPCMKGELMFIETEDEVFLGDVQLRFSVIRKEAGLP